MDRKEINARYYQRTKAAQQAKRKEWTRAFEAWAQSLKDGPCLDCSGSFPVVCMHWHHRDPTTKTANVGDLVKRGNKAVVLAEIAKCDLVCANCHSIRTWV
jgi:hypothetical protein